MTRAGAESKARRTRVLFSDLLNLPRGKYVPSGVAAKGSIGFARGVFATTFDRDLIAVPGTGVHEGLPDMQLELDPERRVGWQPGTDIALGDLYVDGVPFALCPRHALKRAIAAWRALGLNPMVGLELEAFVFQRDADGIFRPYDTPGAFVYGTGPQNDPAGLTDIIWSCAEEVGLPVESVNGEYDNGQFEMTLCFADALKACDDAFLFRLMAREIAFAEGYVLTFMPKPIPERGGSGLHVNFSFTDESGVNVISEGSDLSALAGQAVAGLIRHHEAMSAILAPTINSYDRLGPASMAGYWANWAEDHRLVTTRTSTENEASARLEHRMADGAANPYLAVATVLQAALLGVADKLPLPRAEDLDGLEDVRATRHAPASLGRALDALEKDRRLADAVGALLVEALLVMKRDELKRLSGRSKEEIRDFYIPFI
jgi:glutamine synthetase